MTKCVKILSMSMLSYAFLEGVLRARIVGSITTNIRTSEFVPNVFLLTISARGLIENNDAIWKVCTRESPVLLTLSPWLEHEIQIFGWGGVRRYWYLWSRRTVRKNLLLFFLIFLGSLLTCWLKIFLTILYTRVWVLANSILHWTLREKFHPELHICRN